MDWVKYKGRKYFVDDYNRLILSDEGIEDISEIEGLDKVKGVRSLSLQHNKIRKITSLDNLADLQTLYLYDNEIETIENLSTLTNLSTIILSDNRISKIRGLQNLRKLTELNLNNNRIRKIEGLEPLTKLKKLYMSNNQIVTIEGLETLESLEVLTLDHNDIEQIEGIEGLAHLKKLYLGENKIREIEGLENFENLLYFTIQGNSIPEETLQEIQGIEGNEAQKFVTYCKREIERAELELEKSQREEDLSKKSERFKQFESKFQQIAEDFSRFVKSDSYLRYGKKHSYLSRLENIAKFPWYYRIRYLVSYKNAREKVDSLHEDIETYNASFIEHRLSKYKEFFDGKKFGIKYPLDYDQRLAVVKDEKHNLVIAGAGSGKTSVITSRIAYLVKRHDKVDPERILALAFTKVAAQEMQERLSNTYGIDVSISTFHALGRKIIMEESKHQPTLVSNAKKIIRTLFDRKVVEDYTFQYLFWDYLLYYDEEEIEEELFQDKELYYKYMRNKKYTTLNNVQVKSVSEKDIGNFLFRNQIPFQYEPLAEWADSDEDQSSDGEEGVVRKGTEDDETSESTDPAIKREYHPDFYLPDYDLYIEHWGLDENMEVAPWFTISSEKYRETREWKLSQFRTHGKDLVETWEYETQNGTLIERLKSRLESIRPEIKFDMMSHEELIERTFEFRLRKKDVSDLIISFIQIAKSNFLSEGDIKHRLEHEKYNKRQKLFGKLAVVIYEQYQDYLRKERLIDFNDMINLAVELINREPENYYDRYDHLLVDEFQDISYQRMELINCFVNDQTQTTLFCVGDDWQSIYQFTGSDVRFFVNFDEYFSHPELSFLKRNYRSADNLVSMSNHLIGHNKHQIQKEAYSEAGLTNKPIIHLCFSPGLTQEDRINPPVIFHLLKALMKNDLKPSDIMIIARFNHNLQKAEEYCGTNDILFAEQGPRGVTKGVRFYSAHKSKGAESKAVILSDLTSGEFGFPSEKKNSSIFAPARRIPSKDFVEEERRLFYVALTRAKQYLFLLSIEGNQSIFLHEIDEFLINIRVSSQKVWERLLEDYFPPLSGSIGGSVSNVFCKKCGSVLLKQDGIHGQSFVCSNSGCDFRFTPPTGKDDTCPQCGNKLVERKGRYGTFLGCSAYPKCKYTFDGEQETPQEERIVCPDCGKRLIVKKGKYGKFLGCIGYPKCSFVYNLSRRNQSRIMCARCNGKMRAVEGKYGVFLSCSNYPKCRYTYNIGK